MLRTKQGKIFLIFGRNITKRGNGIAWMGITWKNNQSEDNFEDNIQDYDVSGHSNQFILGLVQLCSSNQCIFFNETFPNKDIYFFLIWHKILVI